MSKRAEKLTYATALEVLQRHQGDHLTHVFTDGGQSIVQVNTKAWRNALLPAEIHDFRWFDLRCTSATWHREVGTLTHELQRLGVWKMQSMVERYAHLAQERRQFAASRLDSFLSTNNAHSLSLEWGDDVMSSNITSGISMNADLLRQRRNLIGISAVLLVFDFANVEITKVSVLGTELLVGNVRVLAICAWVLLFYFLVRYYQYLHAEPDRHIRDSFTRRFDRYIRAYTKVSDQDELGQPLSYRLCRVGFAKWNYVSRQYDPARGDVVDGLGAHLPWWMLVLWLFKTAAFVGIQTPHATDRILPFALAIAAPVVTLYTKWPLL